MAGILNRFKRFFNRRRHQRYLVKDCTLVIMSPVNIESPGQRVQLIDISRGGMAFIYNGSQSDLESSGILKLPTENPRDKKEGIKFDTVSDVPVSGCTETSEQSRRRGVQFSWMGFFDESVLTDLINKVKICEK